MKFLPQWYGRITSWTFVVKRRKGRRPILESARFGALEQYTALAGSSKFCQKNISLCLNHVNYDLICQKRHLLQKIWAGENYPCTIWLHLKL